MNASTMSFHNDLTLNRARFGLAYTRGGRRREQWWPWTGQPSADHPGEGLTLVYESHPAPLAGATVWRVRLVNHSLDAVTIQRITLLEAEAPQLAGGAGRVFCNGWQSWNWSGSYAAGERLRRSRLGPLSEPMRLGHAQPPAGGAGRFRSEMFGVVGEPQAGWALLVGFLSQRQHFGGLDVRLDRPNPAFGLWADGDDTLLPPGGEMATDWAVIARLALTTSDPLGPYLEAVFDASTQGVEAAARPNLDRPAIAGWSSWYQFYRNLSAEDIRRNLHFAAAQGAALPLDLIQIDDGFETFAGDWFDFTPGFPDGVAPLAQEIAAAGLTPGLWLAPYIVDRRSRLAQDHPDWLLRGRSGKPVNAGFLHNRLAAALDLTHPQALDYTVGVIETVVKEWGFPFLKLDFLYAAALPGQRYAPQLTRAQALRSGLESLRSAAGRETFLLGCGCPLGPGVGIFDGMRISADVDGGWGPSFNGIQTFFRHEPDMPAARNAIQNSLTRAMLHRRWWLNDPDCIMARQDTRLTLAETRTLATVAACTGGLTLFSDDLPNLDAERLALAQTVLPPIGARPLTPGWLSETTPTGLRLDLPGGGHRLARFNWDDQPRRLVLRPADFGLAQGVYAAKEIWSGETRRLEDAWVFEAAPAHGCVWVELHRLE